jgi:conjugative transfer region lipoprotein (TIGR03751 family)
MLLNSIRGLALTAAVAILSGCATSKEELLNLPHGERTMIELWQQETGGTGSGQVAQRQLLDARQSLRRPLTQATLTQANVRTAMQTAPREQVRYTRTAQNEINRQFQRLPNPDLVMYVYPHLAGSDPVPVPGYTTVFPFYQRVQYAMPGERVED